jgi:hypothetical protein
MPRVTGSVLTGGRPAANAYVQLRNPHGDFCGETHADDDGHFVLYAVPGHWQLVSWLPGRGQTEQQVEVGPNDFEVDLNLAG